jgi:hypothetical protein
MEFVYGVSLRRSYEPYANGAVSVIGLSLVIMSRNVNVRSVFILPTTVLFRINFKGFRFGAIFVMPVRGKNPSLANHRLFNYFRPLVRAWQEYFSARPLLRAPTALTFWTDAL